MKKRGRFRIPVVTVLSCALALCGACAGQPQDGGRATASVHALRSRGELYGYQEMQEARFHRDLGCQALRAAYACRKVMDREGNFNLARTEFEQANDAYHRAYFVAPKVYHPAIDAEIATVSGYLMQIHRDRQPSWGP